VCEKLIKNSQPFGKKFQKTVGGDFFDSHSQVSVGQCSVINTCIKVGQQAKRWRGHGAPNIPPEKGRFWQFWTKKSDDEISTLK